MANLSAAVLFLRVLLATIQNGLICGMSILTKRSRLDNNLLLGKDQVIGGRKGNEEGFFFS